jgi:hypothetical protein
MGYYGNSRGLSEDLIKEGLLKAGARSPERGLASNADVGAELMRRSEQRLASQRGHRADDDKPVETMTAREMIIAGLNRAAGTYQVPGNRMSDPPAPRTPRR